MEMDFPWLECDENYQDAFCKVFKKSESQDLTSQRSSSVWIIAISELENGDSED